MADKTGNIVLVVESNPAELALAKNALKEHGVMAITAGNLKDGAFLLESTHDIIAGALTSIHYPENETSHDPHNSNGLAFIQACLAKGVKVGVCSHQDHNFVGMIQIYENNKEQNINKIKVNLSLGKKDWSKAVKDLLNPKK